MSLLIPGTNSIKDTGYDVANSLRFNNNSSDSLSLSTSGADETSWTYSVWVKRSEITYASLFSAISGSNFVDVYFYGTSTADGYLEFYSFNGSFVGRLVTNAFFRDPSAWYNIVIVWDSDNSTSGDRMRIYVNGVRVTSFSTESQPSSGASGYVNGTFKIGAMRDNNSSYFFDGYMAEACFIDGQSLDATSFGEFDSDSPNIWRPIDVSGLTFGTNGFHLDFENASSLGADVSGNSNNFTVNNLTSADQSTDTCTNNFMTLSPLLKGSNIDLTEGSLINTGNTSSDAGNVACTFPIAFSGKWYFEVKITAISAAGYPKFAVFQDFETVSQGNYNGGSGGNNMHPTSSIATVLAYNDSTLGSPDGNISITAPANGNIIQFALDMDNGAIYVGVNGTYYNSGDPTSGSSKTGKIADLTVTNQMMPMSSNFNGSATAYNFGGTSTSAFSITSNGGSGNADANGHGKFEYAPPTGYFALCSKNIGEFG
tara:strand:- start:846 stop:2297 length:1452 start_codon:yes stop_codon:yes gene_type:complete